MKISSADEMFEFGRKFSTQISSPAIIQLIGDVGVGKTTFTQGLASGFGVTAPITSPSFTISKHYPLQTGGELIHYDFYRLPDVGIMADDLVEAVSSAKNIVIIEWGDTIDHLLPENCIKLNFRLSPDGSRIVEELS